MYESIPAMKNLQAYISAIMKIPMLTPEEEVLYSTQYADDQNQHAYNMIIKSHLRMVISVAKKYHGYNVPEEDLIQEGNIGLIQALNKFDVTVGARFCTFATFYIKGAIHEYIIKNWKFARVASTKPQRKLFFKMRSEIYKMKCIQGTDSMKLSQADVEQLAKHFEVRIEDVLEMDMRLSPMSEQSLDKMYEGSEGSDTVENLSLHSELSDETLDPINILIEDQDRQKLSRIEQIVETLDERAKDIIRERWMRTDEVKSTFEALSDKYKVSKERIRQVEASAFLKIKKQLAPHS